MQITSAVAIRNAVGDPAVSVTMSPESRVAFAAFSKRAAGRSIEIRHTGRVLSILRIQTPIEGGVLQFMSLNDDTNELARELSQSDARLEISLVEQKKHPE